MTPEDITIMICGPLHPLGIEAIPYYLSHVPQVIYSTWKPNNEVESDLLARVRSMLPDENIIVADAVDASEFDNIQSVYYQACTWSQGANLCKTKYCIKTRTSCKYENMDPMIDAIILNPDKIVCSSIFFRPCCSTYYVYCPSDHIISMKTEEARAVTKILLESLRITKQMVPAERKICFATFSYRGIIPNMNDLVLAREQMRATYIVVDVNTLKPMMYWHNTGPHPVFHHSHDISITDISQV